MSIFNEVLSVAESSGLGKEDLEGLVRDTQAYLLNSRLIFSLEGHIDLFENYLTKEQIREQYRIHVKNGEAVSFFALWDLVGRPAEVEPKIPDDEINAGLEILLEKKALDHTHIYYCGLSQYGVETVLRVLGEELDTNLAQEWYIKYASGGDIVSVLVLNKISKVPISLPENLADQLLVSAVKEGRIEDKGPKTRLCYEPGLRTIVKKLGRNVTPRIVQQAHPDYPLSRVLYETLKIRYKGLVDTVKEKVRTLGNISEEKYEGVRKPRSSYYQEISQNLPTSDGEKQEVFRKVVVEYRDYRELEDFCTLLGQKPPETIVQEWYREIVANCFLPCFNAIDLYKATGVVPEEDIQIGICDNLLEHDNVIELKSLSAIDGFQFKATPGLVEQKTQQYLREREYLCIAKMLEVGILEKSKALYRDIIESMRQDSMVPV